nr:uncharacterized protein LOC124818570 [Hydra vulgaris]
MVLELTSPVINYLNQDQQILVSRVCLITVIFYAPGFLKSSLAEYSVLNDFNSFKIAKRNLILMLTSLLNSLKSHSWYFLTNAVVMALADSDLEIQTKSDILKALLEINKEKPLPVLVDENTKLCKLVTHESWFLFVVLDLVNETKTWLEACQNEEGLNSIPSYKKFVLFIKHLSVTNDCAERDIGLIQKFVNSSHSEDQRQNVLLVVRENRKKISKNVYQKDLVNLKYCCLKCKHASFSKPFC